MPANRLIKPWSISTTVRNPDRLRGFLSALAEIDGATWNRANQECFQILLIQRRLYGAGNSQFLRDLDAEDIALLDGTEDIAFDDAERIFNSKGYTDPAMRGRTSFKPLQKLGFARINRVHRAVHITGAGAALLNPDNDIGDIILRSMLKWRLPNPIENSEFPADRGYSIKPFVATLHLIDRVNRLCEEVGINATGLSFDEFDTFVPTLINWKDIDEIARKVVDIRLSCRGRARSEREELQRSLRDESIRNFDQRHLRDYGDNARRYFRLTRLIRYRGNGRFVDLEPRRTVEIEALLQGDSGEPQVLELPIFQDHHYEDFLSSPILPVLPWQNYARLLLIYEEVLEDISSLDSEMSVQLRADYPAVADERTLDAHIGTLRGIWQDLQRREDSLLLQTAEKTREIATILAGLNRRGACSPEDLEFHVTNALMSLDAAKEVAPNYPVGGDNRPTFTAPGGMADIECFYEGFNVACEVTLMRDAKQWVHEGQPVIRHVRDFSHSHEGVPTYGLFLAPSLHEDTLNMFWGAARGIFSGESTIIFPVRISRFAKVLETCADYRSTRGTISLSDVKRLYNGLATATEDSPDTLAWASNLDTAIDEWCESMQMEEDKL
jgi:hypothetical protein